MDEGRFFAVVIISYAIAALVALGLVLTALFVRADLALVLALASLLINLVSNKIMEDLDIWNRVERYLDENRD